MSWSTFDQSRLDFISELEKVGHVLYKKDPEYGEGIDMFRLYVEPHNGPECMKCGCSWCEHCKITIKKCEG